MTSTQEVAVSLAALGISVIRIAPGRKFPIEHSWLPFTERPRTTAEARREFSTPCNIAIVTGPVSGLVGVDCDSGEAELWALSNLPASRMMVRTPSGGLHLYYRYPQDGDVGCAVKRRGMAIDIRANRGYLLCPDSQNASGRPYQWVHGAPTESLLAGLPRFQLDWMGPKKEVEPVVRSIGALASHRRRARRYIRHIVARSKRRGHDATYRATQVLREFGLSASEAYEELNLWNRTNAIPPWSERELTHKVESVYGVPPF